MRPPIAKRGTDNDPANRFDRFHFERDPDDPPDDGASPTEFFRDASRSILAENDSPDLTFRYSLNPYRGCEHGCIYCYARPSHEYLSLSAGLDFERRILVKHDAPALLRRTFESPRWQPQTVALSGNTDCYQPVERSLGLTRRCLEVFVDFRNPVSVITKNALVARDADLLAQLAEHRAASVMVSITTLDHEVARRMEPRASQPDRRLQAIADLHAAGVPVGVMIAPIIPGLNDEEIPAIAEAAARAGAQLANWSLVRLPRPVDQLFDDWLDHNFPNRKQRILNRIRECRDGAVNSSAFGKRMRGTGVYAQQIAALFRSVAKRHGLDRTPAMPSAAAFRRPPKSGDQLSLL